jgi:glycosyltransferase involved in cell wall biosynthesis
MTAVSVVVPTYNRSSRLGSTLQSALDQTLTDIEVVVVDDASTDDTRSVATSFDDPRVRYLRHETNEGGAAARNTGIEAATGEYVAFLDDDDVWDPRKLERQRAYLDDKSDDWVAAYCDFRVVSQSNDAVARLRDWIGRRWSDRETRRRPEGGEELIPTVLAGELPLGGSSTLFVERDVAESVNGFDPAFPRHQDWEFLVRVLRAGKLGYVDEPLVSKRPSGRPSVEKVAEGKRLLFEKYNDEIRAAERSKDIVGTHRFVLAKHYYMAGQFRRGTKYLSRSSVEPVPLARVLCIGLYDKLRR